MRAVGTHGNKHVLGLRDGATENAAVVKTLLAEMVERGVKPAGVQGGRRRLFMIDGAKALRAAIDEVYGSHIRDYRLPAGLAIVRQHRSLVTPGAGTTRSRTVRKMRTAPERAGWAVAFDKPTVALVPCDVSCPTGSGYHGAVVADRLLCRGAPA